MLDGTRELLFAQAPIEAFFCSCRAKVASEGLTLSVDTSSAASIKERVAIWSTIWLTLGEAEAAGADGEDEVLASGAAPAAGVA